jgi:hypothetical protein
MDSGGARMTSSCVDLGDVLTLVLRQFMWLVVQFSIRVTAQAMSDRL